MNQLKEYSIKVVDEQQGHNIVDESKQFGDIRAALESIKEGKSITLQVNDTVDIVDLGKRLRPYVAGWKVDVVKDSNQIVISRPTK